MSSLGYTTYGVHWQNKTTALCFVGGLLIGTVAGCRMLLKGKVTGISGILSRAVDWTVNPGLDQKFLSIIFVFGLIAGGGIASIYIPDAFEDWTTLPLGRLAPAGLILGIGVRMGAGCTSGHGICGISSYRLRSLCATSTFMLTGFITAMSANTSSYLPPFQNTLPYGPSLAIAFVGIASCILMTMIGMRFRDVFLDNETYGDRFHTVSDFIFGINFALAMAVSNMTKLSATISFLDLRYWNPALAFVMIAGILITSIVYLFSFRRGSPVLSTKFDISTLASVDVKLILGAALFGVGWGLAGACPAPMLTNMAQATYPCIYFVFVVLGIWCQLYVIDPLWVRYITRNQTTDSSNTMTSDNRLYNETLLKPGSDRSKRSPLSYIAPADVQLYDNYNEGNGSYESSGL